MNERTKGEPQNSARVAPEVQQYKTIQGWMRLPSMLKLFYLRPEVKLTTLGVHRYKADLTWKWIGNMRAALFLMYCVLAHKPYGKKQAKPCSYKHCHPETGVHFSPSEYTTVHKQHKAYYSAHSIVIPRALQNQTAVKLVAQNPHSIKGCADTPYIRNRVARMFPIHFPVLCYP